MSKRIPKTKAGKQRKVSIVMDEFKKDKLRSGSGKRVQSPKQAIAIALNEDGLDKKKRSRRAKG